MSINKLALIRYKTIDNCLQNRFRKWTLENLMDACGEAIYECEGISGGVSRRTIQLDIQNMRSEKLGYNAPIVVTEKKYYSYSEKGYSITNTPLTRQDLNILNEVLDVLKQFKGFGYFNELNGMVTRLEDKLYKSQNKGKSFIEFEKNDLLKGLSFIDPLHKAIIKRKVIEVTYRSFKAEKAQMIIFHPYLLKEYRNRWFLLGSGGKAANIINLALDRMESFRELTGVKYVRPDFDVSAYYSDVIGVSKVINQRTINVVLKISREHAPYILTKPLHPSQTLLHEEPDGLVFSIDVVWNFELEREILGFGEHIKVLGPRRLSGKIQARLKNTITQYADRST